MVTKFDNLEDVKGKFASTICYHKDKAVLVKAAEHLVAEKDFALLVSGLNCRETTIRISSPDFRYRDYNIGYANEGKYALWWYRKPFRQYKQGLKQDQLGFLSATQYYGVMGFNFAKPYTNMLENIYPSIEVCHQLLVDKKNHNIAFHRDFALSWDEIHRDCILEYRGKQVGASLTPDLKRFRLIDTARHLTEALQEALP